MIMVVAPHRSTKITRASRETDHEPALSTDEPVE